MSDVNTNVQNDPDRTFGTVWEGRCLTLKKSKEKNKKERMQTSTQKTVSGQIGDNNLIDRRTGGYETD